MERHVNYQLIEKISRNRRKNRDNIKRLIKDKEFYCLQLAIPVVDDLVGNVNYEITKDYKFFLKNGELKAKPLILLKYKDVDSRRVTVSDIKSGNLHSCLELLSVVGKLSYDKDNPTTIYMQKDEVTVPIVYVSVENKSSKFRVDYAGFNSIRNYPDHSYMNQKDLDLSKIIAPYYFTGYEFKVEYITYDRELKNELRREIINKLSPVFDDLYEPVRLVLPDKYYSWRFKKD